MALLKIIQSIEEVKTEYQKMNEQELFAEMATAQVLMSAALREVTRRLAEPAAKKKPKKKEG